jgi:aldehyde dehydrogenase (NAD+)
MQAATSLSGLAGELRSAYQSGFTRPVAWRQQQLRALARLLGQGAGALTKAMAKDMGKPETEAWLTEVASVRREIEAMAREVPRWAKPQRRRAPWQLWPAHASVVPEPLGAVLVVGPWNYPVRCLVLPVASALAAGNTVAAKPSELAPTTASELANLLSQLDARAVRTVLGGPEVAEKLLEQRWDHIFFTGGARVGRLVMAAAARHLTPVTLELGGKNPAIVGATADIGQAAKRIAWGKFLNAGQTCVAPDFVAVDRRAQGPLLEALSYYLKQFFGEEPLLSRDFGRVVNEAHMERLSRLLATTNGTVATGGQAAPEQLYLAPTVISGVGWQDSLMQEEIFGPLLPVVAYDDIAEVLAELRQREKPLAVYVYERDRALIEQVIAETSSGGVCVNHNCVQLAARDLPFGGVGHSGMGAYHGKAGFDTFSHQRAVLRRPAGLEAPVMYTPYGPLKRWLLRKVV